MKLVKANVHIIAGTTNLVNGSGRANIILPGSTTIYVDDALYFEKSRRNLLSFEDIRKNEYHTETINENNREYLYITLVSSGNKKILEKISALSSRLYFTYIRYIETNVIIKQKSMTMRHS